eukprot:jgi/Orpsp1_1/1184547/evm.model.c7180000089981.2
MDNTLDIIILLFCIIDIGLGSYGLINELLLTSSKELNTTYKHYFTEYNASLLNINIMLNIMLKKFNNSIFMFRIEKSAVEKMIIRHEEEKVRKEKNANSIWIILFWIILVYIRFLMLGIITFFAYLNYENSNSMSQIAIFEHLSSKQYHKVTKINAKVNNILFISVIWIIEKFIESNFSWYALGACQRDQQ